MKQNQNISNANYYLSGENIPRPKITQSKDREPVSGQNIFKNRVLRIPAQNITRHYEYQNEEQGNSDQSLEDKYVSLDKNELNKALKTSENAP